MKRTYFGQKSALILLFLLTFVFLSNTSIIKGKNHLILDNAPERENSPFKHSTVAIKTNPPSMQIIDDILTLTTDSLLLEFDLSTFGSLIQMKNLLTLQEISFQTVNHPFWFIDLLDYSDIYPSDSISFDYSLTETSAVMCYQFSLDSDLLEVNLTIQLNTPHSGINFKLETFGPSTLPGIRRIYLPIISDITHWALTPNTEQVAVPEREGWLITNAIDTLNHDYFVRTYPGTLSMQFLVLAEPKVGGFVISALDNTSRHKGISLYSGVHLDFFHYSDNMVFNSGNNFTMDYWVVINAYQGINWAVGASQYKTWALDQWYVEKGRIKEREDVPAWLKSINFVWKGSSYVTDHNSGNIFLEGETTDKMGLFPTHLTQKGLSPDFLLEWWGWGRDGFDRGYPEYYPARDGNEKLGQGIDAVHAASSKVMLYFNGRLVDVTTDTYSQNSEYLTGYLDTPYTETYTPYLTGAIADPSSDWWQEVVLNYSVTAVRDFEVDLVYLDQISVAPPVFDYRDVTTHPPGSGSWWQVAENMLLNRTRNAIQAINGNSGLASENVIETYLNTIDLFWSYHTSYQRNGWFPTGKSIPLFSYVYHPYLLTSGRPDINPMDFGIFFWGLSESLKDGFIPGAATLVSPSRLSISNKAFASLKAAYLTRNLNNFQFFRDGDLLYPATWETSPQLSFSSGSFSVPQGIIQGYRSPQNEVALLFANRGGTELPWQGNLSILLLESGITASHIRGIDNIVSVNNGIESFVSEFPKSEIELRIPSYSFIVLLMNISPQNSSLPTVDLEAPPFSSTSLESSTSQRSPGFSLSLVFLFYILMLMVHRKKISWKR
ncbi:MAG: DUF6259 domain-containing protein [Candidatus Hodarchaeales archaeon]|jgi:hypothetical protein